MKKIGEGISLVDIQNATNDELFVLLGEIVYRRNVFGTDEDDTVLYQQVAIELKNRIKPDSKKG
jgi:hypothetical protein